MLAKIIVHGDDARRGASRSCAPRSTRRASPASRPTSTTCAQIVADAGVRARRASPRASSSDVRVRAARIEVLEPGTQTTVQDYPGPARLLGRRRAAVGADGRAGVPARQRLVGNPRRRAGARDHGDRARRCASTRRRRSRSPAPTWRPTLDGAPLPCCAARRSCRRADAARSARVRAAGRARLPRACAAASTCRPISAAARPSCSGGFGGHGGRALRAGDVLHVGDAQPLGAPRRPRCRRRCVPTLRDELGDRRAVRPARRARLLHRRGHRARSSRPTWKVHYNSEPHRRAPDRARSRSGRARTAARPACIRRTSTTTPTRSAPSTSPATCRSSSAPTARASAASSARRRSSRPSCGRSASSRPGDTRALRARVAGRGARARSQDAASARSSRSRAGRAAPTSRACSQRASPPLATVLARAPDGDAGGGVSARPATTTCWSSTARWCSTSSCASACTR